MAEPRVPEQLVWGRTHRGRVLHLFRQAAGLVGRVSCCRAGGHALETVQQVAVPAGRKYLPPGGGRPCPGCVRAAEHALAVASRKGAPTNG